MWPWRPGSITPKNNQDLNQGLLHLWSTFGDRSLNGWWVIARTNLVTDGRTGAGNDNTPRPILASGKNASVSSSCTLRREYRVVGINIHVINQWISTIRQFIRRKRINECDFTIPEPRVCVRSHISCSDATVLVRQYRLWRLWRLIVSSGFLCSEHKITHKNIMVYREYIWLVKGIANDFHSWQSVANHFTGDQIIILGKPYIIWYTFYIECQGFNLYSIVGI